ncbi:MAG: CinA family nicotinamide mononucleotide deamidase-related protein [Muribaculaceae bacterium]|nr:CinA family nicotinamide mononucleotide deamidase-related protein [Muribaculaceae bacterium]
MQYSTIVIGDELLIGQVTDTNSGWIARHLSPLGWEAKSVKVIADDEHEIFRAIDEAFSQTDVVLMTGGLGPTKDDITKATLCRYFGGEMILNEDVKRNVDEMFRRRGLDMNRLTAGQAMVPSSCRVIQNEVGTAPIMWFERDGKVLVSMPGVPLETQAMMERAVIPELVKHFHSDVDIEYRTFVVIDYAESALAEKLEQFEQEMPDYIHLAYLPSQGVIRLRLTGAHSDSKVITDDMARLSEQLHGILGNSIIADGDKELSQIVGERLRELELSMSTAESCTGGNVAHVITEIAGSSDYFMGSVVSYSNDVKQHVLGVDSDTLETWGAVSQPVVEQMATGACRVCHTHCSVATSGVAGPGGGTPEKPVGTVWIAAKVGDIVTSKCFHFNGTRAQVIDRATTHALIMLLKLLR